MIQFKEYLSEATLAADTHELLTAALIVLGKQIPKIKSKEEANTLLSKINSTVDKTVVGASDKEKQSLSTQNNENYTNLAGAVSAANSVLSNITFKPDRVYLTGKGWSNDIKHFQWNTGTIKDYNSSDIVVADSNLKNFLGVSLKKKKTATAADPTLINNAVSNFFSGLISDEAVQSIEDKRQAFIVKLAQQLFNYDDNSYKGAAKHIRNALKEDKVGAREKINSYLKQPSNEYFLHIAQTLEDNKKTFSENFLRTVFRVDLKNLQKQSFDFALCLGVGQYSSRRGFLISKAKYEDIQKTVEILDEIFGNLSNLSVAKTPGKIQAWEQGATAAKIFYSIFYNSENIIDIEIRYKGSITSEPQFLATATANFANLFKE